jgi:16S rRNA processing protein RimM
VLLEIGHVGRPHGLGGEVLVVLLTTVPERLEPGTAVECGREQLVVESARPLPAKGHSHGSHWLVRFSGVTTREGAEQLTGEPLRAEPRADSEGLWVHELIGSRVVDQTGEDRGTVVAVEANPASDLLVLDSGSLVPLRFVVMEGPGCLTVDVPAGLFEL